MPLDMPNDMSGIEQTFDFDIECAYSVPYSVWGKDFYVSSDNPIPNYVSVYQEEHEKVVKPIKIPSRFELIEPSDL